jgi:uncharacterized protein (DUF1697 family)
MTTYISILRGINVSGQKSIKMDVLKKLYEDLNFENVQTYIQSGNVIFQCNKTKQKHLEMILSNQIQQNFGFEVPLIVLDIAELKEIIKNNPFISDPARNISHLHVTFLASHPEQIDMEMIRQKKSQGEDFVLLGKVVYLYCPDGYGKTKLNNTFFENKLKVGATTRNWNTTCELLNISEKIKPEK